MKNLSPIKQESRFKNKLALYLIAPITAAILSGCTEAPAMTADKSPRPIQVMQLNALDSTSVKRFSGVLESADSANLAFRVPVPLPRYYSMRVTRFNKVRLLPASIRMITKLQY